MTKMKTKTKKRTSKSTTTNLSYTGVTQNKSGTWRARYNMNGKQITVGSFSSRKAAAQALNAVKNS